MGENLVIAARQEISPKLTRALLIRMSVEQIVGVGVILTVFV